MEPITIFVMAAGVLSTLMVYVAMKVSHFGENKVLSDELLKVKTDAENSKKKLAGYTQYAEHLDAARQTAADRLKASPVRVLREYSHVAALSKSKHNLKSEATVIVKYAVEFSVGLDTGPNGLVVAPASNGVTVTLKPPSPVGDPKITTMSHQVISANELPDRQMALADIQSQFLLLAYGHGKSVCNEEAVRALCSLKAEAALRDALGQQPGVRHLPAIFCSYK
ncbi:hypothetical protein [Rhodoferax sp. U11-2br]|uniref:hypothetical protein n=1 Tax=Rhodoferax sp. U11-2br TaxID=2838878 RepID=UPI001BE798DC|nr:hypothetical protein [Rhodoferax sp. U11-2br]MBT3068887.1 hypothetical protein [Rhodoferax sp. U11-2br]